MRRRIILMPLGLLAVIPFLRLRHGPRQPDAEAVRAAYDVPLPAPKGPLRVFHLGHSLVGRDMPAMLAQLAPAGHRYDSQLGWGTSLKEHWQGGAAINGFLAENAHERYRDAKEAIGSGDYDAVVLTEMVEIRDAIRYHDSADSLHRWTDLARQGNAGTRLYLYETWHRLDDPEGWLTRLDLDLGRYWEAALALPDLARTGKSKSPIHIIPAGQVMAAFVRRVEAAGGVGDIRNREGLFARDAAGDLDPIHVNDLGAYLVALTHYAVLYHRTPEGLPNDLRKADGTKALSPAPEAARLMQEVVWQVVRGYDKTGVGK